MKDTVEELARQRLVDTSLDLLIQLEKGTGTRPVLWLLATARKNAAAAIVTLMNVDATKPEEIRACQNEIRLYDMLVDSCRALVARAKDADAAIREEERNEIFDLVATPADARALGIDPPPEDN